MCWLLPSWTPQFQGIYLFLYLGGFCWSIASPLPFWSKMKCMKDNWGQESAAKLGINWTKVTQLTLETPCCRKCCVEVDIHFRYKLWLLKGKTALQQLIPFPLHLSQLRNVTMSLIAVKWLHWEVRWWVVGSFAGCSYRAGFACVMNDFYAQQAHFKMALGAIKFHTLRFLSKFAITSVWSTSSKTDSHTQSTGVTNCLCTLPVLTCHFPKWLTSGW